MTSDRGNLAKSVIVVVLVAAALSIGGVGLVAADDGPPAVPASYFGTVTDEGGAAPPDGTTIVGVGYDSDGAVVDRDTISVQDGQYGGSGGFDDKLRIASDAATVRFYVGSTNGTALEPVDEDPSPGVYEWDLTAPGGAFGGEVPTTRTQTSTSTTANPSTASSAATTAASSDTATSTSVSELDVAATPRTESTERPTTTTTATTAVTRATATTEGDDRGGGLPLSVRNLGALVFLLGAVLYGRSTISSVATGLSSLPATLGLVETEADEEPGRIGVHNATDRDVACKIRCRTPSETIFTETCSLAGGETEPLGSVPDEKFQLAIAIQNGPTVRETREPGEAASDVTIRIDAEGVHVE